MTAEELRHVRGEGMAMIFQNAGDYLNPRRKVCDQYVETLRCHQSMTKKQGYEIAKKMLATLKLPDTKHVMNAYPFQLSGGMKQRVSIVRALSYDAPLLLMDEPFGALDALTRDHLNEELLKIWQKTKKTVIFVTHSIEEATFLSDRVLVMSARPGRVKEMVEIDLPRPRGEATRNDPKFTEYNKYLRGIIG